MHARGLALAATTVVAVALVSGVSYAFWSATGTGAATISSTTAQALTVTASSPVVADLYPGKPLQALTFVISNPNPYSVAVTSAALGTVTSSDATNCPTSNLTWGSGPISLSVTVPAASGGTPGTATAAIPSFVQMKSTALDGCQGKTFTFPLTLSGTQQ